MTQRLFKKRETEDTSYRGKKSQVKIQASFLKEIRTSNPIQTSYCQVRVSINAPSSGGKVFFKSHDEQVCFVSLCALIIALLKSGSINLTLVFSTKHFTGLTLRLKEAKKIDFKRSLQL